MSAPHPHQPLNTKAANRLQHQQCEDLGLIWTSTTRGETPHAFVLLGALALHDYEEVRRAVEVMLRKFCKQDGHMNTSQQVGYFRGVLRRRIEMQAEREQRAYARAS